MQRLGVLGLYGESADRMTGGGKCSESRVLQLWSKCKTMSPSISYEREYEKDHELQGWWWVEVAECDTVRTADARIQVRLSLRVKGFGVCKG